MNIKVNNHCITVYFLCITNFILRIRSFFSIRDTTREYNMSIRNNNHNIRFYNLSIRKKFFVFKL